MNQFELCMSISPFPNVTGRNHHEQVAPTGRKVFRTNLRRQALQGTVRGAQTRMLALSHSCQAMLFDIPIPIPHNIPIVRVA